MAAIVTSKGRRGYFGPSASKNIERRFGAPMRIEVKYYRSNSDQGQHRNVELSDAFLSLARSITRQPELQIEDLFSKDLRGTQ